MHADWVGCLCETCGCDTPAENGAAFIIRSVRKAAGLSRKQLAGDLGYKPSTIKHYEWHCPSKKYSAKFKAYIKQFYQRPKSND